MPWRVFNRQRWKENKVHANEQGNIYKVTKKEYILPTGRSGSPPTAERIKCLKERTKKNKICNLGYGHIIKDSLFLVWILSLWIG